MNRDCCLFWGMPSIFCCFLSDSGLLEVVAFPEVNVVPVGAVDVQVDLLDVFGDQSGSHQQLLVEILFGIQLVVVRPEQMSPNLM